MSQIQQHSQAVAAPARTTTARPVALVPVGALLVFVFLTPLIPRPTVGGAVTLIAPAAVLALALAFAAVLATSTAWRVEQPRALARLFFLLLGPTIVYGGRILLEQQWSESGYFAAQLLMTLGILVLVVWLVASRIDVRRIYRALLWGYLTLAPLMLFVGVTGRGIFESARPTRDYGFHNPFFKAAGVPRSYGELAIFSAVVLAYLLVYRSRMSVASWTAAMGLWFLSLLVAQSRTGFFSAGVVLVAFVVLRVLPGRRTAQALLTGVVAIPLLTEVLYPVARDNGVVAGLIGSSTYQNNVSIRLNLNGLAFDWLIHPSFALLMWGTDRADWLAATTDHLGQPVVIHNFFMSTLMFFGIIGGSLFVVGVLLHPAYRLAGTGVSRPDRLVVYLATVGTIASLQFYEGFFSLVVVCQVATLWYVACWGRTSADVDQPPGEPVPVPGSASSQ